MTNPKPFFVVFLFVLFGNVLFSYAQCPTVPSPFQNFCDLESLLVSDLQATNNGGGVLWYDTASSTTPLNNSASLINGQDYFVDDNTGNCGTRPRVIVRITGPPLGLNFQGVCVEDPNDATISNLVAIGNDIQWYLTQSGGVALNPSTVLNDNTIYYANQSNPVTGCRSSRLSVLVNVGIVPVPTGDPIQSFCIIPGSNPPTVSDLVAIGSNIQWYSSVSSASPLDPNTLLVNGENYFATISDPPCESFIRLEVVVELYDQSTAGTNGNLDICEGDTNTYNLINSLGGTPDAGGTWSPTLSSGTGLFNPALDAPGVYTYTILSNNTTCNDASASVTVTFIVPPIAGTNGSLEICEDDTNTYDLFNSLGGTPDSGGTWSPTLNSGTGLFDPALDAPGIYTYTVLSSNPTCSDASASVTVTFAIPPVAGTDGSLEICEDDTNTYDLFNSLGGNPDSSGTWSPSLNSGTGLFNPALDTPGIYTYTVASSNPICNDASASVNVSIVIPPVAGSDGSLEICDDDSNSYDLFNSLGGTPDSGGTWSPGLNSGTGLFNPALDAPGIYTYTVLSSYPACSDASAMVTVTFAIPPVAGTNGSLEICENDTNTYDLFNSLGGTPDTGGTWSPSLNSGTGLFNPALDAPGVYTYTISNSNSTCSDVSATVTVTFAHPPEAGTDGNLEICENDINTYDLFNSLGGTPDTGGTWSPSLNSGTGLFNPALDAPGTYTYTVLSSNPICSDASASVTVTFGIPPVAGTDGSLEICENDTNTYDLFNSLGGSPDSGGTWSPTLNSGTGLFNPALDAPGIYTYTVSSSNSTCSDASASIIVTFEIPPVAGQDGSLEICENDTNTYDLFNSLGGTPDAGGTWSPSLNSGTGLFNPALDAPGIYTYTVLSSNATCSDASATVTVTFGIPPVAGTDGSLEICENDTNTYDLFNSLGGSPDTGGTWSPTLNSGTGLFNPAIDAPGSYTYTVSSSNSTCSDASAFVTVTFEIPPEAGQDGSLEICENDTNTYDLFNSLGGSPDAGGTWSPSLNSGTGLFDPALDTPGIYTYTVLSSNPTCSDASSSVTVTFAIPPVAGTNGSLEICENDTNTYDLFNSLGGSPDTGGTWSPTLNSGTGLFDPALDAPGTYTYTVSSSNSTCSDASASVVVTLIFPPDAGINGSLEICEGDTNTYNLFNSLGGTPDSGGTWSPSLISGTGLFDPALDAPGTYTYTVTNLECGYTNSADVTVSITELPDVTGLQLSTNNICQGENLVVNIFNANALQNGNYFIIYNVIGANNFTDSVIVEITNGAGNFDILESTLTIAGNYELILSDLMMENSICGVEYPLKNSISFEVYESTTPILENEGNEFCNDDNPTIENLSSNITNSDSITWYDSTENGDVIPPNTLLINGDTYYASIISSEGCPSLIRLAVTVNLIACVDDLLIPDGFSPNGDNINDTFHINYLNELYPNFKLEIYNRYGNKLYTGGINTPDWDGKGNAGSSLGDSVVPVGVYFYVLEFNDGNRQPIQGRVYLNM